MAEFILTGFGDEIDDSLDRQMEVMDGLGYTTEEIAAALKEIQGNFRQFLEWSKDGEYVAYYKMAQRYEQATGIEAAIDEEPGAKPIFGKEI